MNYIIITVSLAMVESKNLNQNCIHVFFFKEIGMKTVLVVLGTRPEAIKLAPVILELREHSEFNVLVCNTEQQKELSNQTLGFFGIKADFNLNVCFRIKLWQEFRQEF